MYLWPACPLLGGDCAVGTEYYSVRYKPQVQYCRTGTFLRLYRLWPQRARGAPTATPFTMGCCGSTLDPYALAVPILPDNTGQTSKYPLAGKPPARANVAFRFKVKVPKHILYNNMTKKKDAKDADDMKVPGLVVHEEGAPGSPWAAMSDGMYGELAPHFNVRAPLSIHRSLPTRHPPLYP